LVINADGMTVVNSVAETNVVVSGVVPTVIFAPVAKFVPLTVSVNAIPPCMTEFGLNPVIAGGGSLIVNVAPAEVPLIVVTDTLAVP